jgi:thymidylate synthase
VNYEDKYLNLLEKVIALGEKRLDRTGTNTYGLFCPDRIDIDNIDEEFPLLTSKKIHWKSVVHELLWFIKGDTNVKYLNDNGVTIWDEWCDRDGSLGKIYGHQLRKLENNDQLKTVIESIKIDKYSRRHVISLWGANDINDMNLPTCHGTAIQFYVRNNDVLDMYMYQRSADLFLGVPFNIASYALFLKMVSQVCEKKTGKFFYQLGDAHIYSNHLECAKMQLGRKYDLYTPPTIELNPSIKNIEDFKYEDINLRNYSCHAGIKAEVSI